MKRGFRTERDYLGTKKIPKDAYYGVQTKRALDNFQITNLRMQKELIYAITAIKKSAALTNLKAKKLNPKIAKATRTVKRINCRFFILMELK